MEMNNETELIEKYRKSDFGDRIFLSLAHRDLRSKFLAIDLATEKHRSNFSKHRWLHAMSMVWREIFSNRRPASDFKK